MNQNPCKYKVKYYYKSRNRETETQVQKQKVTAEISMSSEKEGGKAEQNPEKILFFFFINTIQSVQNINTCL